MSGVNSETSGKSGGEGPVESAEGSGTGVNAQGKKVKAKGKKVNAEGKKVNAEGKKVKVKAPSNNLDGARSELQANEGEVWDPRVADANSVQNLIGVDGSNEEAFVTGIRRRRAPRNVGEIPCKFPLNSNGQCWKGIRCRYKHDPEAVINGTFDYGKQIVASLAKLEKPTELIVGGIFACKISAFVDFSEFYVIPQSSHACICEYVVGPAAYRAKEPNCTSVRVNRDHYCNQSKNAAIIVGENEDEQTETPVDPKFHREGHEALLRLEARLNVALEKHCTWRRLQGARYAETELVAVQNEPGWWERGVIMDENVSNSVGRDVPLCVVRLIDRGPVLTVSAARLCSLPLDFCNVPPLAIRCCLAGVVPVRFTWNKEAGKQWYENLYGKRFLMVVRQKPSAETKIARKLQVKEDILPSVEAYSVDIIVPPEIAEKENSTRRYMSDILAEKGIAISASKFPYRPELECRYRNRTVEELLLQGDMTEGSKSMEPYTGEKEEEQELERFKTIVDIESHDGPPPNMLNID